MSASKSDQLTGPPNGPGKTGKDHQLAFGVERIGLFPLRFPVSRRSSGRARDRSPRSASTRIKVDNSLSQLFRSDTPEFKQYEEVTQRFPSSEFDVLIVVEGKSLLERDSLSKLRDLVTDLQLIDGTRGHHLALLGAPAARPAADFPAPLFPEDAAGGRRLRAADRPGEDATRSSAASSSRRTARWRWSCSRSIPPSSRARASTRVVGEIRKTVTDDLEGTGRDAASFPACRSCSSRSATRSSATGSSTTPSASSPAA